MSKQHNILTALDLHVPGYQQNSDPGAVGTGKVWIDTSLGAGKWVFKTRNAANDGWENMTPTETDPLSLHLDQTTPQTIINGIPIFEEGISIRNNSWDLKPISSTELGLYVNGILVQSWEVVTVVPITGNPIGLLLALTYA